MTKKPYSECVFTIVERSKLDRIFEDGGDDSITEGKRWVTAQEMKRNADREGKSLFVLFADAAQVNEVLYYAPIGKIEVPLKGNSTTYTFTNLLPIPWPCS